MVLATIWLRAYLSGREELRIGLAAERAGDVEKALLHYQFAMRWYTPLADAPQQAAESLWTIALQAEARGDRATALTAHRDLRGAIYATRSLYDPFGHRLNAVNRRLARLTAEQQLSQASARGRNLETLEADHLRLLELDPTPAPGWSLVVVLGFLGWVGGAFALIARGFGPDIRVRPKPFMRWASVTAICFAAWVVGLIYA